MKVLDFSGRPARFVTELEHKRAAAVVQHAIATVGGADHATVGATLEVLLDAIAALAKRAENPPATLRNASDYLLAVIRLNYGDPS
jgi:hypothetical protein